MDQVNVNELVKLSGEVESLRMKVEKVDKEVLRVGKFAVKVRKEWEGGVKKLEEMKKVMGGVVKK